MFWSGNYANFFKWVLYKALKMLENHYIFFYWSDQQLHPVAKVFEQLSLFGPNYISEKKDFLFWFVSVSLSLYYIIIPDSQSASQHARAAMITMTISCSANSWAIRSVRGSVCVCSREREREKSAIVSISLVPSTFYFHSAPSHAPLLEECAV